MLKLLLFLINYSKGIKYSRLIIGLIIAAGIISGISNTALLALINSSLSKPDYSKTALPVAFIALCLLLPLSRLVSEIMLIKLSLNTMLDLRLQLSRRVLATPLRVLEQIGTHHVLAILTDDIPSITNALISIPALCINSAIVVACFAYLSWLSLKVLLGILCLVAIGVAVYELQIIKSLTYFRLVREQWNALFKHFRALTEGAKELRLHRERREAFLKEHLEVTAKTLRDHNVVGNTIQSLANCGGQVLVFVIVGLLIFLLPSLGRIEHNVLIGYTLAFLYMMSPLQVILNTMPTLGRAGIAVAKVEEMGIFLSTPSEEGESIGVPKLDTAWRQLELTDISHCYHLENENSNFVLGPLSLTFYPGEMVFLIGGNGSGKTTFAKLLVGLYTPESGQICLDGQPITKETREQYRQLFSVVFSEFFIFEALLGMAGSDLDARAFDYLKQLHLDQKVRIENGVLSTTDLSRGQRKRLALLAAYLEDRPFYIFDEWAADQDPIFKEIFYYQLLPELRDRGKTILVISHDDHYYHVADRIVKLDGGKIGYNRRNINAGGTSENLITARNDFLFGG
jgi:putative ATP-binding cassette transporter